ncbi:hypothetical protein Lal_00000909 [Lupinus albus]|nr:hypothetical protein Lal_00000909 [Lupinus albus]
MGKTRCDWVRVLPEFTFRVRVFSGSGMISLFLTLLNSSSGSDKQARGKFSGIVIHVANNPRLTRTGSPLMHPQIFSPSSQSQTNIPHHQPNI